MWSFRYNDFGGGRPYYGGGGGGGGGRFRQGGGNGGLYFNDNDYYDDERGVSNNDPYFDRPNRFRGQSAEVDEYAYVDADGGDRRRRRRRRRKGQDRRGNGGTFGGPAYFRGVRRPYGLGAVTADQEAAFAVGDGESFDYD